MATTVMPKWPIAWLNWPVSRMVFLGVESARNEVGITVSYWRDLDSIRKWKENVDHSVAREKGRTEWYKSFKTRIAQVERDYGFES
jgi:heme-degrading monooxygenase HmoA